MAVILKFPQAPWKVYRPKRVMTQPSGDVTVVLTGASVTVSDGTLSTAASVTVSLVGSSIDATSGALTPLQGITVQLVGASAAFAPAGAFTPSQAITIQLVGASVAALAGGLVVQDSGTVLLTGAFASLSAGTLSVRTDGFQTLTGSTVTATVGTLVPSVSYAPSADVTVPLVGSYAQIFAGSFIVTGADVPKVQWVMPGIDVGFKSVLTIGKSTAESVMGTSYQNDAGQVIDFLFLDEDETTPVDLTGYHGWVSFWYRGEGVHLVRAGLIMGSVGRLRYFPWGDEFYKPGVASFQATVASVDLPECVDFGFFKTSSKVTRTRVMAA